MVAISPFRALRYNTEIAGDLGKVLAPPYDVINSREQDRLYEASPYNVVRLIFGKQFQSDTSDDNRYTRARCDFDAWIRGGVFKPDGGPSLYLVEHTFVWNNTKATRLGFLGLLHLDSMARKSVYRHEGTLSAPKEDRTKLLEAIPANLSPVFCVYPDPECILQRRLEDLRVKTAPSAQAKVGTDTVRMWNIVDLDTIGEIAKRLAKSNILIADGHHRFEVAFEHRARYGALMTYFVSMADNGLRVRPIHRLISRQRNIDTSALRKICVLKRSEGLENLLGWVNSGEKGRFGCYVGGSFLRVTVAKPVLERWLDAVKVAREVARLDVSVLHSIILPELGVVPSDLGYAADPIAAVKSVQDEERSAAWFLQALPLAEVYTLASQGYTLPPKSTFFYPKVLSGLALNPLEESTDKLKFR